MSWHKDVQWHEPKQLLVTFHTVGSINGMTINSMHTCPNITTEWWPHTVTALLKKEMNSKSVDSISLIEVECVS